MKKIFVGLIACAVLLAMTGVVSAADGDFCKATGGGTLNNSCTAEEERITIGFNGQGHCNASDAKGQVNIVYHADKSKQHLDVLNIDCCCEGGVWKACLYLEGDYLLCVWDKGEGNGPHGQVCFGKRIDDENCPDKSIFCGCLNGNVQVHMKEACTELRGPGKHCRR